MADDGTVAGWMECAVGSGASSFFQNFRNSIKVHMSGTASGFLCLSHSLLHSGDIIPTITSARYEEMLSPTREWNFWKERAKLLCTKSIS